MGEGPLSAELEARAASLASKPGTPMRVTSAETSGTASVTVKWYQQEVQDTGGVPLTGFKLYHFKQSTSPPAAFTLAAATLAFDGSDQPEITEHVVTGLDLDADYSFVVTALNPDEGP